MKRTLLTILSVLFCAITFAQSVPQGINYQAVARDVNGSVTNSGSFSATAGTGTLGTNFVGQFSGNSGSGTWINSSVSYTGTWEGSKE